MAFASDVCRDLLEHLDRKDLRDLLTDTLDTAEAWVRGTDKAGDCIAASRALHRIARETDDPLEHHVIRAFAHALATAHMADHAMAPLIYGMKAIRETDKDPATWKEDMLDRLKGLDEGLHACFVRALSSKGIGSDKTTGQ
jgi:hypothetical protein